MSPSSTLAPATARHHDAARRVAGLWSFTGKHRVLHLTWFAFFLSFVVWFNFAPFANTIQDQLGLTDVQRKTIGLVNVALTVPARLFIGMALDRWGPRRVYAGILTFAVVPNTAFALAQSFEALMFSRLALSVVGAGFVVGIRMVSEWFPPKEVGTAEGVYGGWGNFGSAAAAFSLPVVAGLLGGDDGWRWAIGGTGVVAAAYGLVYLRAVTDTPEGVTYARPRRQGALEVTSPGGVAGLAAITVPINAVLLLIAWRIWIADAISDAVFVGSFVVVVALLLVQEVAVFRVNRPALQRSYAEEDRYPFRSVAALCIAYFATFGSELAVVTMLPSFFADTWGLGPALAGAAASGFAFMNLVARPVGGLLSDLLGSRTRTLSVLLVGLIAGYSLMALVGSSWPWWLAVVACMCCSFFVQSGEGAVFAVVPLVKKRVSGQVAGLAGAFGNVGAVVFLTAQLYVSSQVFFLLIAGAAVVALAATAFLLVEPKGSFDEELAVDEPAVPERVVADRGARSPQPVVVPVGW
ncbi:NarK family nitrate/nitrite MFS transporter [Actinomarinicola tropica]|uniref:Nitrate/nitrite transporter n=1 Tax=Actinomarinicola tropica TaxID=2789776 RepID=A0A5Q2RHR5_9ACTN|nr:NarK family nitrate/nitrite MFS transporter [Actinomarinicola tropica]QGG96398.1 NarK family nitrate/nitrite MFS transporter [Actinomarinicola tropica]